ncbi:MAG TPA: hypothetical protein VMT89_12460, partial [Candidatus Acidoferrales bacterium]|nr:hypothetical protein [Candidatus Acidoferrales bacterium]
MYHSLNLARCRRLILFLIVALAFDSSARRAGASCNQLPSVTGNFRGSHGGLDRPFAGPGDVVEVQLSTACNPDASFTAVTPVVTVVFTPPRGPQSIISIADDCAAIAPALETCAAQPQVANAKCVQSPIQVLDAQHLRFSFPDTDALVDAAGDDRTLSGPATIAVSAAGRPPPCALIHDTCGAHGELLACIDALYAINGTCDTQPDPQFKHFTALPPPNDYQQLCVDPQPPCNGKASELRFTIDADGNALVPMDWRGILVGQSVPIARLLRGSTAIAAFPDSSDPIQLPSELFLRSFSQQGGLLPPVFEPHSDPSAPHELTLFGSADAPQTVLWVARRSPTFQMCSGGSANGRPCSGVADECPNGTCGAAQCVGGTQAGASCSGDGDCPSGECGAALFDFSTRLAADGAGPMLISRFGMGVCQTSGLPCAKDADCTEARCVAYRLAAADPVPLDGLAETPQLFVSVVPEAIDGIDLNGDGDAFDDVLLLSDHNSGVRQPIGVANAPGRAASEINQSPFRFPALAVENDIVAFLEAEPAQGNEDANGDGDQFDSILRVWRSATAGASELTAGMNVAVDSAQAVNGRSVVVSNGKVYFRRSEAAGARRRLMRVDDDAATLPALSANGQQLAFERGGTAVVRDLGTHTSIPLVLQSPVAAPGAAVHSPSLSADGRYVAVSAPDTSGVAQIFLHDRDADGNGHFDEPDGVHSSLITASITNDPGDLDSTLPFVTPDALYVAFQSQARNLGNGTPLRLQTLRTWIRAVGTDAQNANAFSLASQSWNSGHPSEFDDVIGQPSLSSDGRLVAFASLAPTLVPNDTNEFCVNFFGTHVSTNCSDIFDFNR